MKKIMYIIIAFSLVILTGCHNKKASDESTTQIANPWVDCSTLSDAVTMAGFDLAVPERLEGYPYTIIQAVKDEMIQVLYYDKEDGDANRQAVMIRKGKGTEDISGDYYEYKEIEEVDMHGVTVQLKGNKSKIYNAIWTQDGYAYAVNADKGLSKKEVDALVELIK